jgi:hypothetical protein
MGFLACLLAYFGALIGLFVGSAMMACAVFAPANDPAPHGAAVAHAAQPVAERRHADVAKIANERHQPRRAHVAAAIAHRGPNKVARGDRSQQLATGPAPDSWSHRFSYAQDLSPRFGEAW